MIGPFSGYKTVGNQTWYY